MYLVAIAWMYVVVMMTVAEALAPNGTVLGAAFTFLLYGVGPLSIVLYLMATPARRRARRAAEQAQAPTPDAPDGASGPDPDCRRETPGDAVAAERKEA